VVALGSGCTAATSSEPAAGSPPSRNAGATPTIASSVAAPAGKDLQATLDQARASSGAPGALALIRHGTELRWLTSGVADLDGTEIMPTTRFRIGSITKSMVATLVLSAVARGDVGLDDVVHDILPGRLRADPPITVRMLLDHTSGVFDEGNDGDPLADVDRLSDPALAAEARDLVTRYAAGERVIASDRLLVALAETHERYFAPGKGNHYSNINYQLAAMVLQQVSGAPLTDLLRDRIAAPLRLHDTSIAPPDLASPDLRGYVPSPTHDSLVDVTDDLSAFGNGGHGGVVSTAHDLLDVMDAIVSGQLIGPALTEVMQRPTIQSGNAYGLGLATYRLSCGIFYGHGGAVAGTVSIALVDPTEDRGVVAALDLQREADAGLAALADDLACASP